MFFSGWGNNRRIRIQQEKNRKIQEKNELNFCYNGGNQHKFGHIHEEQPVNLSIVDKKTIDDRVITTYFKFIGILRKINIDEKTPVFCRCEWCGKITKKEI